MFNSIQPVASMFYSNKLSIYLSILYTHANCFIRIEISLNVEQRQYRLGSFEKQGNSGKSSKILI